MMASTSNEKDIALPLTLSMKRKKPDVDIEMCILCQINKKVAKPIGTDNGRTKIREACSHLKDQIITERICGDAADTFVYHLKCYKLYVIKGSRASSVQVSSDDSEDNCDESYQSAASSRTKRSSLYFPQPNKPQVCIICNHSSKGRVTKLNRICEVDRAESFLAATRFNLDAVFDRTSTLQDVNSVFAADIMCHKRCINQYILQYKRDMEREMNMEEDIPDALHDAFYNWMPSLQLESHGYVLTDCRILLNSSLPQDQHITNRKLKQLLINHFGEEICFTYPKDKTKSQMFFSSKIAIAALAENIRASNSIKHCAEQLRQECKDFDFGLTGKFCDANDLSKSMEKYDSERPVKWKMFFDTLLPSHSKSKHVTRKCDTMFQIAYTLVHDGRKKTPMHVSTAQAIHGVCRSKTVIQILNRMGLCMSYDELERQDHSLVSRTIARGDGHRVPLPPVISSSDMIHGAMDNFDHEEDTKSGIGGSHDTVLVIFQKTSEQPMQVDADSFMDEFDIDIRKRTLEHTLPCQQLLKSGKPNKRGDIPHGFVSADNQRPDGAAADGHVIDVIWFLSRFRSESNLPDHPGQNMSNVPSWSAFNSLISTENMTQTTVGFTPIIPHPATQYDTIFTCMINFQDTLMQTGQEYGSLWCDEGVYRIAKELQLLLPQQLSNIFLGLGGFHMSKVVIACIGKYLQDSGVENILIENEVFGPLIVQSILNGTHYSRALRGLSLIAELMQTLLWKQFLQQNDSQQFAEVFAAITLLQSACHDRDGEQAQTYFYKCKDLLDTITPKFDAFVKEGKGQSDIFNYWSKFLTYFFPLLRDMTRSHREGNWQLHLSAIQRSLPLFFAFDKTNYSRWGAVFYEDCLQLPHKFPSVHADFLKGHFVVKQSNRKFSCVPMDQALEQMYNKPAKGPGGIVGITRRKESIAQHDLIKQEKVQISFFLRRICGLNDEDEYSLHHEFSDATTKHDALCMQQMLAYVIERDNPFDLSNNGKMRNLVTGKEIDAERCKHLLNCIDIGQQAYDEFVKSRFQDQDKKLFDPIPKLIKKPKKPKTVIFDTQKETTKALHLIDIARTRSYDISQLLTYELTSTSFYLTKDGFLRKSPKSELTHVVEKKLQEPAPQKVPFVEDTHPTAIVIDFMASARKVPVKQLKMKTFGDMAAHLWKTFSAMASTCKRIDIVFDLYEAGGIKGFERIRRCTVDPIEVSINRSDTPLPIDFDRFWASISNKAKFEAFFIRWITEKQSQGMENLSTPVLLGGAHETDTYKCIRLESLIVEEVPELRCKHQEADDRLLLHVQHATCADSFKRVIVASADTDVFICLLYHFNHTWNNSGLLELWVLCGHGSTSRAVPIHDLVVEMPGILVSVLPALHALTGCDTTSKVSTKQAAFKFAEQGGSELIKDFGKLEFTSDMEHKAEKFLASAIAVSKLDKMDEIRYFQYHHKGIKNNFEKLAPTSSSTALHIKRAYLQCYQWINATDTNIQILNPLDHGYELQGELLVPIVVSEPTIPDDFPHPCTCVKCFRPKICPCRVANIMCCDFCKCAGNPGCKNPNNARSFD